MNNLIVTLDNNDLFFRTMANITCRRILKLIQMFPGLNINAIALQIGQTQANISTQVKNLETANLVQVIFKMGRHGVSKTISLKHRDIIINLREVKQ